MTTETKSVAQQLVDIIMPSNEHARSEAVIRIEAALEAAERAGAEMEREECARMAMFNGSMPLAKAIRGRGAK